MDKRKLVIFVMILFGLALIFSGGIGSAAAASGDTIYVNGSSGNDSWDGQSAVYTSGINGPKLSIKSATGAVNTDGTVNIADGKYAGINNTQVTINRNMNIIGQSQRNTIINGTGTNWIFQINTGISLNIINLTLTNGTRDIGGAIYSYNSGSVTATNITFTNNKATNGGGAINIYNGALIVTNCAFNGNTAKNGGAIYNLCTLTVTNTTFNSNTAINGGGAIFSGSRMTATNTTIQNNNAGIGGGIFNADVLICKSSIIQNNTSNEWGGGIYTNSMSNFDSCIIQYNNAIHGAGGGIANDGGSITVNNCIIQNNISIAGGGIVNANNGILNVYGSIITNNTADTDGGAIFNTLGTTIAHYNVFNNNHASSGSAISSNSDSSLDATHNWWGTNNDPRPQIVGLVNYNPWIVLNVTANPTIIKASSMSKITADLLHDNTGTYLDPNLGHVPNGTPIYFTTNLGQIDGLVYLNEGFGIVNFTSGTIDGTANINATMDGFSVFTNLIIDTKSPAASANPTGGLYNTTKTVSLTMSESGKIYFTTNGTQPTTSSNIYSGPITINTTTTLKYLAEDLAGNTSPIYTETYTIDTKAPTANANPTGGLYNTTKNVVLTMNKTGKIYYTTNGTQPTKTSKIYSGPISIKNTTTLRYLAIDLAGNKSLVYSAIYTIDKIPPKVSSNIKSGLYNTNKIVKLSMNKKGTIYYTLNGKTPTITGKKYTGPITIKSTSTLKYLAVDMAGDKSPIYTNKYTIDKKAPKVVSSRPKSNTRGTSLTASLTIKFSEKINKGTKYANIYIKNITTGKTAKSTVTSISGNTITIRMILSRLSLNSYWVYIPKNAVKDKAGNNNNKYVLKFKTSKY